MSEYNIAILGDLNIDIVTCPSKLKFGDLYSDWLGYADITLEMGGTAGNFASYAPTLFKSVTVIGAVGDDSFGDLVGVRLKEAGAVSSCKRCPSTKTGLGIYVRDQSEKLQKSTKLVIIDVGANNQLEVVDIERNRSTITRSDILLVDGYSFLAEPRRSAVFHAMCIAREASVLIALDLVPHRLELHFSLNQIITMCAKADIVISEVGSILRILNLRATEIIEDASIALAAFENIKLLLPNRGFLLRYGAGSIDKSLICLPDAHPIIQNNGYCESKNIRGFGDRLTAHELNEYLKCTKR